MDLILLGSEEIIDHLKLSCRVTQWIKCTYYFFLMHGQIDPIAWICQDKLILQLVDKVVFLDWLLNFITTSLFDALFYCSSYEVICIWIRRFCVKVVLKFPVQCLKCWPFLRFCIPALQHDVIEMQWTIRWLRESIVLTQHLDYLSTCHT